jgi:hypothetical protein
MVLVSGRFGGQVYVYAHQHSAAEFGPLLEPIDHLVARAEAFAEAIWYRDHGYLPPKEEPNL